jgi:hypothetical protein
LRLRDQRDPVVHVITHAALHVPRQLVTEVAKQAHLFGVFILPSGGDLDLEYLDLMEGHAVVNHETLGQQAARANAASKIVSDVSSAASNMQNARNLEPRTGTSGSDAMPQSLRGSSMSTPPASLR